MDTSLHFMGHRAFFRLCHKLIDLSQIMFKCMRSYNIAVEPETLCSLHIKHLIISDISTNG